LLTLIGPGGIGKTRLAIEVTSRHKGLFPDGIWFVPLAPLSSPEYLIPAIADALNFKCHGLTNPRSHLLNYLRDQQALLIFDNIEHLLDGVQLFTEILENCRQVKLLVTSRERLNLLHEWVFEIQGLPTPTNDQTEVEKWQWHCFWRAPGDNEPVLILEIKSGHG
jgi:predicted ATPase